jgi:hypothetical protein
MKKNSILLTIILILAFFLYFSKLTGYFVTPTINISIAEKKEAKILLDWQPVIDISQEERIRVETVNTGSVPIEKFTTIRIYFFNGSLFPMKEYQELNSVNLYPGERHSYSVIYYPPFTGTYYIQARVKYDGKAVETWARFDVIVNISRVITPIVKPVYQPPEITPQYIPTIVYLSPPKLQIEIKNLTDALQDSEAIIVAKVKNLGERDAFELKPYISYPSSLEIRVSPLFVEKLSVNESISFLLSIKIPKDFLPGLYQLTFEISSNETKTSKSFFLNVSEKTIDLTKDIQEKILSLKLLLSEARSRIYSLYLKGFDVSKINASLDLAEVYINRAEEFLKKKDFNNSLKEVEKAREEISNALINLETLTTIAPKAFPHYIPILIIAILIVATILIIIVWKRRKPKKPKLLREREEETQI